MNLGQYCDLLKINGLTTLQAIITEENAVILIANQMKGISKKKFLDAVDNLKRGIAPVTLVEGGCVEEHGERLEWQDSVVQLDYNYCLEGQEPLSSPLSLGTPFFRCAQCKIVLAGYSVRCVICGKGKEDFTASSTIPSSLSLPDLVGAVRILKSIQDQIQQDQIDDDYTLAMLYHIIGAVNDNENEAMRITLHAEGLLDEDDVDSGARDTDDLATTAPAVFGRSDSTVVSTLTVSTAADTQISRRRKPHGPFFRCYNGKCRKLLPSFISFCPYCGTPTACTDEKQKKTKKKRQKAKPALQKLLRDVGRFLRSW